MIARRPGEAGGFGRAAPALGRRLVWVGVALMSLTLSGCASLGLPSICGPCGPVKQLGRRIFNRPAPYAIYDEPGLIGVAAPPVEVIEAPPMIEGPALAPAPGPTLINPPPPAEEAPPLDLRPLDNGSSSSNKPATSYQSLRPRDEVQTARHEAGSSGGLSSDPLKNFVPRLEAPADLTGVPLPADEVQPVAPEPIEEAEASSTGSVRTLPELQPTPESDAEASTDPVEAAASLAPGFRSFLSVEPRLAGGSLPESAGWSWLADQGFRTVLDLRPLQESRHEDLAQINSAGLRYLALPIQDEEVGDPTVLDRFAAEIGEESARPIYFFDTEGSRAAVLWYLHRVVNQQGAPQDAARQADEIGPRDPTLWARAMAFVDQVRPPATSPSSAPMPPEAPVPDLDEAPVNPPIPKASLNLLDTVVAVVTPLLDGSTAADDAPAPAPPAPKPQDPHAWRSFAALAVAGLTVPLAFFGRSAVNQVARVCHRASLPPGPPPPKSLPDESDA